MSIGRLTTPKFGKIPPFPDCIRVLLGRINGRSFSGISSNIVFEIIEIDAPVSNKNAQSHTAGCIRPQT